VDGTQCGRFWRRFGDKVNRCEKRKARVKTIIQYSLNVFYVKLSTVKLNNILLNENFNLGTQSNFWCKNKMTTIGFFLKKNNNIDNI